MFNSLHDAINDTDKNFRYTSSLHKFQKYLNVLVTSIAITVKKNHFCDTQNIRVQKSALLLLLHLLRM